MKNLVSIFLGVAALIFLTSTSTWPCWGRDRGISMPIQYSMPGMGACAAMMGQQTNMMDKGQNTGEGQGQSQQKEYSERSTKEDQQKGAPVSDCCPLEDTQ